MAWVKNLDLDDKSSNGKLHSPARSWRVTYIKHTWERTGNGSKFWTPTGSSAPLDKCLTIEALCSLD